MKKIICTTVACIKVLYAANATIVFSDNFDTYSLGDLVGQGGWALGNSTTNPIQVIEPVVGNNAVQLMSTGQDDYKAFTQSVPHTDGNSLVTEFDVTIGATQANGDFFAHVTAFPGATLATDFFTRIYAKTNPGTGTGFVLGFVDIGPPAAGTPVPTYGTRELNLNVRYHVATTWNFVAGPDNDTFTISVDGTPYLQTMWASATPEPTTIGAFNLRQGSATGGPTISAIDNVLVSVVPEPSIFVTLSVWTVFLCGRRHRALTGECEGEGARHLS